MRILSINRRYFSTLFFVIIIVCGFLISSDARLEQNDSKEEPLTSDYYVFLYTRGSGWIDGKTALEQPFLQGHFEHMSELERKGLLIIGGPFKDESGVMGVLEVSNLEEARRLISKDPVIQNKILEAEVKAWEPVITGCIAPKSK